MAKMRKISVDELKPGMIYDRPIFVDSANMLVNANSPIKESDIKKLNAWGVSAVETTGVLVKRTDVPVETSESPIESEKKIVDEYNELVRKRRRLIEIHGFARNAVNGAYNAIRKDQMFETKEVEEAVDQIISIMKENSSVFLFLYGLDEGKDYTLTHSVNVTFYALLIGMALKYDLAKLRELGTGTLLIDAGMVKVPIYILHKQSNLTDQEFNQIKTHPLLGYKALRDLGQVKERAALISLQHHEQFDGKGYPRGLRGGAIDEYARIASIADSYEAQITTRSYKKKIYFYHAMRNLLAGGVNKFDPVLLRLFLSRMSVYPIGSIVELNNNAMGIVIGSIPEKPLRPIVKLIFDINRKKIEGTSIINLLEDTSLYIVKAMDESEAGIDIFEVL